jgi:hypothetical protein
MQRNYKYIFLWQGVSTFLFVAGVLLFGDAHAIDGNYAAPYGSQWGSRSQIASLPLETLFAALLVLLNLIGAAIISVRGRKRQSSR